MTGYEDERHDSIAAKDEGMALALTRQGIDQWKAAFRSVVEDMPPGTLFTSEDVLAEVGLPTGKVKMHGNNAVGAMMGGLAKQGLMYKSGRTTKSRRRVSHATEVPVWVRAGAAPQPDAEDPSDAYARGYLEGYDAGVARGREIEAGEPIRREVLDAAYDDGRRAAAQRVLDVATTMHGDLTRNAPVQAHNSTCYRHHPACAVKAVGAVAQRMVNAPRTKEVRR